MDYFLVYSFMSFNTHRDACYDHHDHGTELFPHHKTFSYAFVGALYSYPNPWQLLICVTSLQFCIFENTLAC